MLKKISNNFLVNVALGTFIVGTSSIYFFQRSKQKKVKSLPFYQVSLFNVFWLFNFKKYGFSN